MKIQIVPYGGWKQCLRLANDSIDAIVTTEVGPRIIRFGFIGGVNEFVEYPEQMGLAADNKYHSYGGHRLWTAPEVKGRTDTPDNAPVKWKEENGFVRLTPPLESTTGLQKEILFTLDAKNNSAHVIHRITNHNLWGVTLSAWALSVMASGGTAIIPQESYTPHSERVLPVRPLALWGYTKMNDERWLWGEKYIRLKQMKSKEEPQKIGTFVSQGWAGYVNENRLFVKRFGADSKANYPDFGCKLEVFTNTRMLEVESLSPFTNIAPGETLTHEESWHLFKGVLLAGSDEEIEESLRPLIEGTALNN
jgi:hypothetical protein